jgi:hypothetical protein
LSTRDTRRPTLGWLVALVLGAGLCLAGFTRGGLALALGAPVGGFLVLLSLLRCLAAIGVRSPIDRRPQPEGAERAAQVLASLVQTECRRSTPDDEYDPSTGAGVGEMRPDPTDLDLETIGGATGVAFLQEVFAHDPDALRRRLADRLLLYLEVDARSGAPLDAERRLALRERRAAMAEHERGSLRSRRRSHPLAGGAVLLTGTFACFLLVHAGAAVGVVLLLALATGALGAILSEA